MRPRRFIKVSTNANGHVHYRIVGGYDPRRTARSMAYDLLDPPTEGLSAAERQAQWDFLYALNPLYRRALIRARQRYHAESRPNRVRRYRSEYRRRR